MENRPIGYIAVHGSRGNIIHWSMLQRGGVIVCVCVCVCVCVPVSSSERDAGF